MDTKLLELESGMTQNESVTWAVSSAIEAAVLALIEQGDERGYWTISYPDDWEQIVAEDERAYWMQLNSEEILSDEELKTLSKEPTSSNQSLWKKILLKENPINGEKE